MDGSGNRFWKYVYFYITSPYTLCKTRSTLGPQPDKQLIVTQTRVQRRQTLEESLALEGPSGPRPSFSTIRHIRRGRN